MKPDRRQNERRGRADAGRDRKRHDGPPENAPKPADSPPAATAPDMPAVHLRSASYSAFIYSRMIGRVDAGISDGDLVPVMDKRGQLFGWGFFNGRSQIALRMFSYQPEQPPPNAIAARIAAAVSIRRDLLKLDRATEAYRLVHAEGDGLPGLVADRFGRHIVIELFSLAMFNRLHAIQDAFVDAGLDVAGFVARADKSAAEQEGFHIGTVRENKDRRATITENGVKFHVQLSKGHKTGFFCDQRENRLALSELAPGRRVLDVCCYSGGFACHAAVRGAASVEAVDLDENAIELARQNAELNAVKIDFQHADAFDHLRRAAREGRKWDVVVVDPSKFVPRRDTMELGLRKYADLNRLAAAVVSPGGLMLTCSCSGLVDMPTFIQIVGRAGRSSGRTMRILRTTGAGPDHPTTPEAAEAAYLKAVWARLD